MDIAKRTVVYTLPGAEAVAVARHDEIAIHGDGQAAVVIVNGYRDAGFEKFVGCKFMETGWATSWSRLIAASGMAAITYPTTDPESDLARAIAFARTRFARVMLLATSGHGPLAVSALDRVDGAVLITAYTIEVPEEARKFGFVVPAPAAGSSCPLFIARGGKDEMPGLNETLDRFAANALRDNASMTLVNHARGPHAFDLFDDSEETRAVVRMTLEWLTRL